MRCSEPTATAPRTSRKRRRAERGDEEAEWFACACAEKMVLSYCRCTIFSRALRVEAHHSAASLKGHRPHRVLAPCVRLDDLGDDSETDRRHRYRDAARQRHDAGFSGHAVVSEVPYGVMTVAADRTCVRMHGASVPRHQNPYASPPARSIQRHFLPVPGQLRSAAARPL